MSDKEKVAPLHIRFRDEAERMRVETLAGEMSITEFVLNTLFRVKRGQGSRELYPGWNVVERRRDLGIKIARDPAPVGKKSPVILYPEDDAYMDYAEGA